jgi:hypothetical protein
MVNSKKKVLFVAYGGGHVNMIAPVVTALMQRPGWEVIVLGLTTAGVVLAKAGIPYIGFKDLVSTGDEEALAVGRRLSEGVTSDLVPHEETVAYMGLSYADLQIEHGVDGAARVYAEKGRHAFLPVRALERALRMTSPDMVVTTNAPRGERAALLAARKLGIPSLCLLDLYPPEDGAWLKENWYGTRICVLNQAVKDMLVALGRNDSDILVTGNPAFDRHYLFQPAGERLGGREVVLGLASNLLPGIPDGALQRAVFDRLQALCRNKKYTLAVRQHPNETPWTDVGDAVMCNTMPIEAYLGSLDKLVTFPSTIALEAQIHGVPVALLDFTSLSQACFYLFQGDFECIEGVEAIDQLEVAPAARQRAERTRVSATANVCDAIQRLLEEI